MGEISQLNIEIEDPSAVEYNSPHEQSRNEKGTGVISNLDTILNNEQHSVQHCSYMKSGPSVSETFPRNNQGTVMSNRIEISKVQKK